MEISKELETKVLKVVKKARIISFFDLRSATKIHPFFLRDLCEDLQKKGLIRILEKFDGVYLVDEELKDG